STPLYTREQQRPCEVVLAKGPPFIHTTMFSDKPIPASLPSRDLVYRIPGSSSRRKRSAGDGRETGVKDYEYGGYLDAIGQPRGIPERYKARNEIWTGLESLIPYVTVNKNADWIN